MDVLHVFYDRKCGLCKASRDWLLKEPKYLELHFVPYQSREAEQLCPGLRNMSPDKEMVVMSDTGEIYQGGSAWVMCLYALRNYRVWSMRLATPRMLPLAKKICHLVSENRLTLSKLFLIHAEEERIARKVENRKHMDQQIRAKLTEVVSCDGR